MEENTPVSSKSNSIPSYGKIGGGLRTPKCTRCRNHGMISDLRGHKHKCFWRDCTCRKCLISSDRQRATADRIALFRQQVRQAVSHDQKRRYSQITDDDQCTDKGSPEIGTTSPTEPCNEMKEKNSSPPPLTKVSIEPLETTYSPTYVPHYATATKMQWVTAYDEEIHRKNIEILKYIFPFYDTGVLNIISRGCHNDMLQTVLSISSCVLESRKHYPSSKENTEKRPDESPSPLLSNSLKENGCCSSLYCPVNSYLHLRNSSPNFHHYTPPLTAGPVTDYKHRIAEKLSPEHGSQPLAKKFRFSFDDDNKVPPFCNACKKYGMYGDKFCPLCGILYQ